MSDAKDRAVTIRMSADEFAMLVAAAKATGLSQSDVIRQGIRQAYFAALPADVRAIVRRAKPKK